MQHILCCIFYLHDYLVSSKVTCLLPSLSPQLQAAHVCCISLNLFNFLCLSYTYLSSARSCPLSTSGSVRPPWTTLWGTCVSFICSRLLLLRLLSSTDRRRSSPRCWNRPRTGPAGWGPWPRRWAPDRFIVSAYIKYVFAHSLPLWEVWVICNTENNIFRRIQFCMSEVPYLFYLTAWLCIYVSNYIFVYFI